MSRCITISRLSYRGSSIHVSRHNSYSSLSSIYLQYNARRDLSTNCHGQVVPNLIYGVCYNNNTCNEYTTNFRRLFSNSKTKSKKLKTSVDPFKTLGITKYTPYAKAKKKFLMIAMKHHPDTTSAKSEEEQKKHREIFMSSREAFEALVADEDTGGVMIREEENGEGWEDAAMDSWFKDETGYDMPFMDQATMKEVAEATETMGGGLARDGGMWELAKMVSKSVKDGSNAKSILQLEVGDVNNQYKGRKIDGKLRRRKRL